MKCLVIHGIPRRGNTGSVNHPFSKEVFKSLIGNFMYNC